MTVHAPGYVAALATELRTTRPAALRAAEDDLQAARAFRQAAATFINNPTYDHDTRCALAETLGLPTPRPDTPKETTS